MAQCNECGGEKTKLVPAGVSKAGKSYDAFYACPTNHRAQGGGFSGGSAPKEDRSRAILVQNAGNVAASLLSGKGGTLSQWEELRDGILESNERKISE